MVAENHYGISGCWTIFNSIRIIPTLLSLNKTHRLWKSGLQIMLQDWREAVLHLWDQGLSNFVGQRPLILESNDEII